MALLKRGRVWWADLTMNGRRHRESLGTTDRREAKSREKELIGKIQAGKVGSPAGKAFARLRLDAAADVYLKERTGRVAERTVQFEKERLARVNERLGGLKLNRITAETISEYQRDRIADGVSGRTVNMEVAVLSRILKKAKLWLALADDVSRYPEASSIGRVLTEEEKARLFQLASTRPGWMVAYCAAVLAASTTCRKVELRHLRWRNADLIDRKLTVERSKTDSGRRTIPLNADAVEALKRLRKRAEQLGSTAPEHYVFPWCYKEIDPERPQSAWRKAWRNLTAAAGLKGFRFHDLRHTAITELAEAGTQDATLMALAGHMTRRMLEHYSHARMKAKRNAVDGLSSGLIAPAEPEKPGATVH